MKIKIWSDLHLEFSKYDYDHIWMPGPDDSDTVLLLCGDIGVGSGSEPFIEHLCQHFKEVLLVLGNHEFYHSEFYDVINNWKKFEDNGPANFHFMNNEKRFIDGVRFLGGTMWTSFNNADQMVMITAEQQMNDYAHILNNSKVINPKFIYNQHREFVRFLQHELNEDPNIKTIVLTHHSPGSLYRSRQRRKSTLDFCYFADLENLIGEQENLVLWCHGHDHSSHDYTINNAKIISNPYGYIGYSTNYDFEDKLIIEI